MESTIETFKVIVARRLEIDPAILYGHKLTLASIIAKSPSASNSIDLVEAVAGAMAELEIDDRIELPAISLDDTIDDLVAEVTNQLERTKS